MQLPGYTERKCAPAAPIKRTQKERVSPTKYVKMVEKTCAALRSKAVENMHPDLMHACMLSEEMLL